MQKNTQMQFTELQLNASLLKAIAEERFQTPTLVQEQAIPPILAKKNVIVSAQTGTGKTAAFALPILQLLLDRQDIKKKLKRIKSLIVTPTRELCLQIEANFKSYAKCFFGTSKRNFKTRSRYFNRNAGSIDRLAKTRSHRFACYRNFCFGRS